MSSRLQQEFSLNELHKDFLLGYIRHFQDFIEDFLGVRGMVCSLRRDTASKIGSWPNYKKIRSNIFDGFGKSRFSPDFVILAKAGLQLNQAVLGSRLRGSDSLSGFLRDHHILNFPISPSPLTGKGLEKSLFHPPPSPPPSRGGIECYRYFRSINPWA